MHLYYPWHTYASRGVPMPPMSHPYACGAPISLMAYLCCLWRTRVPRMLDGASQKQAYTKQIFGTPMPEHVMLVSKPWEVTFALFTNMGTS